MKKVRRSTDELRPEYPFAQMAGGVRGKYAQRYRAGTNIVRIAPDVAAVFASEEAVNEALRTLLRDRPGQTKQTT